MKQCTKCHIEKEFSEFYRRSSSIDGYRGVCKSCIPLPKKNEKIIFKVSSLKTFISAAEIAHGHNYSYEACCYNKSSTKVKIYCVHCAKHFLQTPVAHIGGQGCPTCGVNKRRKVGIRNTQDFIEKAKSIHSDLDFSKVSYINNSTKINISCTKHGDFSKTPRDVLLGKGCAVCKLTENWQSQLLPFDDFVAKSNLKHSNRYIYNSDYYTGSRNITEITCKLHGTFLQAASDHMRGRGCPSCASSGYSCGKGGHLYVLTHENLVKVGISNRPLSKRLKEINRASNRNFKIAYSIYFQDGGISAKIEQTLLKYCKLNYKQPADKFLGCTEVFVDVHLEDLYLKIDECLKSLWGNT